MFQTKVVEKKTRFMFSKVFFSEVMTLWDNVEKYCRTGQDKDDITAHTHFTLGT